LRYHRIAEHHGSRISLTITKDPLCQQSDISEVAKSTVPVLELDKFPEEIVHLIHSRMPLRDAAHAACVSRSFLHSWRRYPNLVFSWQTFGLDMNEGTPYGRAKKLVDIIQTILKNHSGTGVKTLKLQARPCRNVITADQLDTWLQAAVKAGIVELALDLPQFYGLKRLKMIEINAPKVSTFLFRGSPMKISISNSSQLNSMTMNGQCYSGMFQYALTKLQSITSNLQTLTLLSSREAFNMPVSPDKFLHLRNLKIYCCGMENFDFFFSGFFSQCLSYTGKFLLIGPHFDVRRDSIIHEDSSADASDTRRVAEFHQRNLKKVAITGFCSAKSLIELTCQILESSSSLLYLVLDTTGGYDNTGICDYMERKAVMEALRGVEAIQKYIKGKVPSSVTLEVLERCGRCHIPKLHKLGPGLVIG
ncbi:hypothetical protein BAE44_0020805, partial [Dichanthelium oligosanthes]